MNVVVMIMITIWLTQHEHDRVVYLFHFCAYNIVIFVIVVVAYFVLLHWLSWFLFIPYFYFDFTHHFIATDSKDPSIKLSYFCLQSLFLCRLSYRILQLPQCPDKTLCQLDLHSSVIVKVKWLRRKEDKNMSTLSWCEYQGRTIVGKTLHETRVHVSAYTFAIHGFKQQIILSLWRMTPESRAHRVSYFICIFFKKLEPCS